MAFTQDYIELCYKYKSIYRGKSRKTGDWYGNLRTSDLKVLNPDTKTDFDDPEWFYIPDLDDLFEFLEIQIKACQVKERPAQSIELVYHPTTHWHLQVKLETSYIFKSVGGKSPHEVVLQAIYQMSPYATAEKDPAKKAKALFMKNKYRELYLEMEMFMDDEPDFEEPISQRKNQGFLRSF